ncbi:MAG TPA: hypothetical protein VLX29_03180, partial [Nitrospirota bacterium]|nr:hypothetical protein [Nitrospirota bacterium]
QYVRNFSYNNIYYPFHVSANIIVKSIGRYVLKDRLLHAFLNAINFFGMLMRRHYASPILWIVLVSKTQSADRSCKPDAVKYFQDFVASRFCPEKSTGEFCEESFQ